MPYSTRPEHPSDASPPKVQVPELPQALVEHTTVSCASYPADPQIAGQQTPAFSKRSGGRLEQDLCRLRAPEPWARYTTKVERRKTGSGIVLRNKENGAGPEEAEQVPIKAWLVEDLLGLGSWMVQMVACL